MKKIFTLFIISLFVHHISGCIFSLSFGEGWGEAAFAQVPTAPGSYQWVKGFGSANQQGITDEMINAMKLDNEGNIIVCGRVMGYPHIQGLGGKKDSLISNRWQNANNFSGYISKYDCNGNLLWFKEINDSINGSEIFDFVIDSSNNIYAWGKCNAGGENIYFGDTLFAPFQFNSPFQGPVVMLALNKNGNLRWNYIQPVISIFNGYTLIPENQNASGSPRPNMMAIYKDTISVIGYSGVTQHTITIGNVTIKHGYSILRFTTQGSLVDATWLDSTGYCTGFGIDNDGNYIAGFNFYEKINPFLDSSFNRNTVSYFNYLSTIIKFNRHHVIRHIEFGDTTGSAEIHLIGGNQFCTSVSGYTNRFFYGNNKFKAKSGFFGNQTTTGGPCIFNDLTTVKWFSELDTSTYGGAITLGDVDVNGDVYANWSSIHYQKFRTLSDNLPNNDVKNYPVKLSYKNGDPILKYAEVNTPITKNYSNQAYFQNILVDKLGNIYMSGNLSNNQVIVGTDTAKYYGGNNDMFIIKYGNVCGNNLPMIAAGTPGGLQAACNGTSSINIKWNLVKNGEDKYYIYRSLAANSGFVKIDSVAPTINTYTDANVVLSTNYWYAVSTHNVVGEGYLSLADSARLCDTLGGFVSSVSAKNQLSVFPNPTKESLVVSRKLLANTIEVCNLLGQHQHVTIEKLNTNDFRLTTENLPSGIYFIKATDINGNVLNGKFVKE